MQKKKKAVTKGKVQKSRKRSATKDLSAKKAGSVKGGALVNYVTPPTKPQKETGSWTSAC